MGLVPAANAMLETTAPAGVVARVLTIVTVTITTTLAPRGRTGTG